MQFISLTVKSRNGVTVNQTEVFDIENITGPLIAANSGADSSFVLSEGKKSPQSKFNDSAFYATYIVDQTLAQIAVLAGYIFTANVITQHGRPVSGSPLMGFDATRIAGPIIPFNGGSQFSFQTDGDPDLIIFTVTQTPAQILAQITSNTVPASGWLLNGNTVLSEKFIGTIDAFDFPVRVHNIEVARFKETSINFTPAATSSGIVSPFIFTIPSNTNQTASVEAIAINIPSVTIQHATGALATQRNIVVGAPTYSFVAASTISDAYNMFFSAPVPGANATITRSWAAGLSGNFAVSGSSYFGALGVAPTATGHFKGFTNDSTTFAGKFENLAGSPIAQFRNDQAAIFAGPVGVNGGIDITYALTVTGKVGGAIRVVDSGSNEMLNLLNNHKLVLFDTGLNYGRLSFGSALDDDARIYIKGIGTSSSKYGIYYTDSTESPVIFAAQDNGSIGMGALPSANAILDLQSTTKAFKLTRVTTVQRNAITAEEGMILEDTDIKGTFQYDGTNWVQL